MMYWSMPKSLQIILNIFNNNHNNIFKKTPHILEITQQIYRFINYYYLFIIVY